MIRFIFALLVAILLVIFACPVVAVQTLIGRKNKDKADRAIYSVVQWIFRVLIKICGVKLIVQGQEKIPTDAPVLYIGNHLSVFDIVITYAIAPNITGYIAKDSLKKIPIFRWYMKLTYCLLLNRKDLRQGLQVINQAIEYVKDGKSICIFPEGTRSKTGEVAEFKNGSFKIATKTDCPVVPIAISNTNDIIRDHIPFCRPTKVVITYCDPFVPSELPDDARKNIGEYTRQIIIKQKEEDAALIG